MTPTTKRLVIDALIRLQGDDVFRARHAFKRLTPAQMQEQHGQSGQTRQQVLASYEQHYAEVQAAIDEVKNGSKDA